MRSISLLWVLESDVEISVVYSYVDSILCSSFLSFLYNLFSTLSIPIVQDDISVLSARLSCQVSSRESSVMSFVTMSRHLNSGRLRGTYRCVNERAGSMFWTFARWSVRDRS